MRGLIRNHKKKVAAAAIATGLVGGFEGLRTAAYPDPATKGEPWTICYGETKGVKRGDRKTPDECKTMLGESLGGYIDGVTGCLTVEVGPHRLAALTSFAYNVGSKTVCNSSVVRRLNAGEGAAACDDLMKYDKARIAGVLVRMKGLTRRRAEERAMCRRED